MLKRSLKSDVTSKREYHNDKMAERSRRDIALTKRLVVKITVERWDKIKVTVSQIFYRMKSVALWSTNIRKLAKDNKSYGSTATYHISSRPSKSVNT